MGRSAPTRRGATLAILCDPVAQRIASCVLELALVGASVVSRRPSHVAASAVLLCNERQCSGLS